MGTLSLPSTIVEAYRAALSMAPVIAMGGAAPIGGASADETFLHFQERFPNSAARAVYASLDPLDTFAPMANYVQETFADGEVTLLDAPCGAGASSAAIIGLLVEFRALNLVPKLPVRISVLGADHSPKALELFDDMFSRIAPTAAAQGVHLTWHGHSWDATNIDSTAALCDRWFTLSPDAEEHVILISNISGAAGRSEFFERFDHSVTHLVSRLHNRAGTVLWIEPCMRTATRKLLPKVKALLQKHLPKWVPASWAARSTTPCDNYLVSTDSKPPFPSSVTVQHMARD